MELLLLLIGVQPEVFFVQVFFLVLLEVGQTGS